MATPGLFLQLYSLRHEIALDAEGTIRRVAGLGFDGVELAGDYGWPASRWQTVLDEAALTAVAAHAGLEALENDLPARVAFGRALGINTLVVPALCRALQNPAGYREAARRLNAVGRKLADEGFTLGYHNHAFEFDRLEPARPLCGMDLLLSETDPDLVHFEFDTFWLEYAGRNAVDFIRRHAARVFFIHAKDLRKRDREDVPAGAGDVDFPALLPLCCANSWQVILEYESDHALEAVRRGAAHLRPLLR